LKDGFLNSCSIQEVISCFRTIHSLLHSETEIEITLDNYKNYKYLAEILGNNFLKSKCFKVIKKQKNQIFRLSTEFFPFFNPSDIDNLKNFQLVVNNETFLINFEMMCCISELFLEFAHINDQFQMTIPDEHVNTFQQFLSIFDDGQFYAQEEPIPSLLFLVEQFKMQNSLLHIFIPNVLTPQSLDEAIDFLSKSYCCYLEAQFQAAIKILIHNILNISTNQLICLNNTALIHLVLSSELKVPDEDFLLNLINEIIQQDSNRKYLLSYLYYPFVSSNLMIKVFQKLSIHELDDELFQSLKQRLFSDVTIPNSEIPFERWSNSPKFISKKEIEEIFTLFNFTKNANIVQNIQNLIQENEQFKNDNNHFQTKVEQLNRDKQNLNQQIQTLTQTNTKSTQSIQQKNQTIEQLNRDKQNLNQQIQTLTQTNTNSTQSIQQKNQTIEQLNRDKQNLNFQVQLLTQGTSCLNSSPSPNSEFFIASAANINLVLDISGGGKENFSKVIIWERHGDSNQLWKINGDKIISVHCGRSLDIEGGIAGGRHLIIFDSHGGENQRFRYNSDDRTISIGNSNLRLDISGGNIRAGTQVIAYEKHCGGNQQWVIIPK
jgi:hypothetical protein